MNTGRAPHSPASGEDVRYTALEHTMARFDYEPHGLVEVLITAQEAFGCLSRDVLTYVADRINVPVSHVYGVATFYDTFTLEETAEARCRVCTGPACAIAGSRHLLDEAARYIGVHEPGQPSADGRHSVGPSSCLGLCDQAPAALVGDTPQVNLSLDDIPAMLRGAAAKPALLVDGDPRVLTAPIGVLEPTDLDAHIDAGAFIALEKALREMTPTAVIDEVTASGLAGRGGAGFETGLKWAFARSMAAEPKYVVCNFDESEPGTFKDRVLMEGNPYRVIEGLLLAGYATGSSTGYIFIRGEYRAATEIIEEAIDELYIAGLLGRDILGASFDFDVEIRHNAGAYICGEETALFEAIEGKRGYPRCKPPYPTQHGLFGQPTAINNVETLAVVPALIEHGGAWFRQWGTPESIGLKLFCLSGHVHRPGVVEAPYGLTVRELVEDFGGGFDGEPGAVLIGGAAGGFLTPARLDTPLTHEDLAPLEVPVGSGAVMVFNRSVNLWEVVEGLTHFFVHEACGQCAPCRLGTKQIHRMLRRAEGGPHGDIQQVEDLGETIKQTCVCGLGMTAANPVLTVLHHFHDDAVAA